jgi:hypothetical protein
VVCEVRGPFFALQRHAVFSSESRLPLGCLDRGFLCLVPLPFRPPPAGGCDVSKARCKSDHGPCLGDRLLSVPSGI